MDTSKYLNKTPLPPPPNRPFLPRRASSEDALRYAKAMAEYEKLTEAYRKALDAYRIEDARLMGLFKQEVLEDNGLTGHPKADKVYALAWDYGHGNGLAAVAIYASELTDLVKD